MRYRWVAFAKLQTRSFARIVKSKHRWLDKRSFLYGLLIAFLGLLLIAHVYDMGVRAGQMGALATAYEVCKKVGACG